MGSSRPSSRDRQYAANADRRAEETHVASLTHLAASTRIAERARIDAANAAAEANSLMAIAIDNQTTALETQNRIAEQQLAIASERHQHWQTYFRPIERRIARDAEVGIDPNQMASRARSDLGASFDQAMSIQQRNMERMGVNPNSGRYISGIRDVALARAAATAGVMNQSRLQADQINWTRRVQAAALGAGIPVEVQQGLSGAANTTGNAANAFSQTASNAASVANQGGANVAGAGANAANVNMGAANLFSNASQFNANRADALINNRRPGPWGAVMGLAGMAAGLYMTGGMGAAAGLYGASMGGMAGSTVGNNMNY